MINMMLIGQNMQVTCGLTYKYMMYFTTKMYRF